MLVFHPPGILQICILSAGWAELRLPPLCFRITFIIDCAYFTILSLPLNCELTRAQAVHDSPLKILEAV